MALGRALPMALALGLAGTSALAQAPPRIFFTDLESGPGVGGEGNLGAFVTIVGKAFGATQGASSVTVGGGAVGAYRSWSDTRIVVQLGGAAQSGTIVVQTAVGSSNGVPFTVRPGNIYFVALGGDDGGVGSFQFPWGTIVHAKDSIAAGDIAYIRDGVSQTAEDNYNAALSIETSGAAGSPKALVAYPGALATVGSTVPGMIGLRIPNIGIAANDWVIAGIRFLGEVNAIELGGTGSTRWRVARNDISCPVGDGQTGCFAASQSTYLAFLGNQVHDISSLGPQPSKQYHAVYLTTDTNHVDVGFNHIHDNRTCRAIQFHSSPLCVPDCGPSDTTGFNQYDLVVHDNLIHGDVCDGINFATVDPSQGPVQAYNNVIYLTGQGPDPPDGSANYAGIYVAAGTNTGPDGTGTVEVYNNTLYANGTLGGSDAGQFGRGPGSPGLVMSLRNNIVYSPAGEDYLSQSTQTSDVGGTSNVWFGDGPGPAFLASNVDDDPDFVDAAAGDFHLLGTSPALDIAAAPVPAADFDGVPRPQGPGPEIGAFERVAAAVPSVSIGDMTLVEGDAGPSNASFTVTLSTAASGAVTVAFASADGSATAGSDYLAASGTLSFAPGSTSAVVTVSVLGDTTPEPDETFQVVLSGPSGATLGDAEGLGLIVNDDAPAVAIPLELVHGTTLQLDLAADPGPTPDVDLFRIRQQPRASYEIVVDATSGDLGGPANPVLLERVAADLTTVLQVSAPIGQGASRSLRWEQPLATAQDFEVVRVRGAACGPSCDSADVYRLRSWATTAFVPRFNNSATQITVVVLENGAAQAMAGTLWFWGPSGGLLGSQPFTLAGRGTFTLNTAVVPGAGGTSGSLTVSHTGRYGDLSGKAVSVEPATGFTFDTPLLLRPR